MGLAANASEEWQLLASVHPILASKLPSVEPFGQSESNCEILKNFETIFEFEMWLLLDALQEARHRLGKTGAEAAISGQTVHQPMVHFGLVASGNMVMKSGEDRDQIAAREDIIAFEREGAGVWDNFPCLVIKGVCDYADSHKSKRWQNYAAATAAACMKAFLENWVTSTSGP